MIKDKHDPVEFSLWARNWFRSRTRQWWEDWAEKFNEGRPEEDHFKLKDLRPTPRLKTQLIQFRGSSWAVLRPAVMLDDATQPLDLESETVSIDRPKPMPAPFTPKIAAAGALMSAKANAPCFSGSDAPYLIAA